MVALWNTKRFIDITLTYEQGQTGWIVNFTVTEILHRPEIEFQLRAAARPIAVSLIMGDSMSTLLPETPEQLAESLRDAASVHRTIRLGGNFRKTASAALLNPPMSSSPRRG